MAISRSVLAVFIVLVAIIGGMSGLEGANLTRPPVTVTATLQEAVYATVTESVTKVMVTRSSDVIVNCISMNIGGGYTPGLMPAPTYFSIGFSEPGPGSLKIELWGLFRAVTATVDYAADASVTSYDTLQFTIPAIPYRTYYSKLVPVPLPQGGTVGNSTNVEFSLGQPEGAGVVCLTLTWIPS